MIKLFTEDYFVLDVKAHSVNIKSKDEQSGWVCDILSEEGATLALNRDFKLGKAPFEEPTELEWSPPEESDLVLPTLANKEV